MSDPAAPADETVTLVNKEGDRIGVPKSKLAVWAKAGYEPESKEAEREQYFKEEYGDSPWTAAAQGAASVITFGGSDVYLNKFDPEGGQQTPKQNEGAYMAGGIVGGVLSAGVGPGGLLTSAGKAAEAATVAKVGSGLTGRVTGAVVRGGTEGLGYGVGAGIGQVALSDDPLTFEGAVATIGSNALGGAAIGGVIGGAGKLMAESATVAKNIANKQVEVLTKGEQAVDRTKFPEYATMDQKAIALEKVKVSGEIKAQKAIDMDATTTAIEAEETRLVGQQGDMSRQSLGKAKGYKKLVKDNWIPVPDSEGETKAMLGKSTNKVRNGLNNEKGFIRKRGAGQFEVGLEEQDTVYRKILQDKDAIMATAEKEHQKLLDSLPHEVPKPERYVSEGIELPGATSTVDDSALSFHEQVVEAARRSPTKFGEHKTLIADVWDNMGAEAKANMTYDDFQNALRAERRAGRLELSRADFPEGMDQNRIDISGTPAAPEMVGTGDVHFVNTEFAPVRAAPVTAAIEEIAGPEARLALTPEQATLYRDWAGLKQKKAPKGMTINGEQLAAFRQAVEDGTVKPLPVLRIERTETLLEANQVMRQDLAETQGRAINDPPGARPLRSQALKDLEAKYEKIKADTTPSERMQAILAQEAELQGGSLGKSITTGIGGIMGGGVGFSMGGQVGAMGGAFVGRDLAAKFYDRYVRKLVSGNAARGKAIKATIAGMFAKGADKAAKVIPYATKAIPAIQYASKERTDAMLGPSTYAPAKSEAVTKFRERFREINSLTQRTAPGIYQVRLDALKEMHERNAALWQIAPMVANGVEKLQRAKIEYLASKMPRNPAPPHLQVGPDNWEPGKAEVAKFYRIMDAAEHPEVVVQRVAAGTATPDDVETLKTVYPSHYEDVRQQCMNHMAMLQETLPYVKRLNLSILLDVEVDPALTQQAMSVYQRPPPDPQQEKPPAASKPLPTGMVEPTRAQRYSSK